MTCQDVETLLHPYVDGELEGAEQAEFEAHVASCETCRQAVAFERAFKARVRAAASEPSPLNPPASEALRGNIVASIHAHGRRHLLLRPALAVSGIATLAASVAIWLHLGAARERESMYVQEAVAFHRRQLPLEVTGAQMAQVRSWFSDKVDFPPSRIPQLQRVNLVGARLSNMGPRPAAYVAWGTEDQRRVSMFVFDAPDLTLSGSRRVNDRDVLIANQHGYNVALWKDREIAYSLVSDLDEQDILELVAASRK